jgi:hypothetical protein
LPACFAVLLIFDFIESNKFSFSTAFAFVAWLLIVIFNRYISIGENHTSNYTLEFGEKDLTCKFKNSIFWYIPFSKLSHVAYEEIGSDSLLFPKSELLLFYTKEGDSYSIPIKINANQTVEIKEAVERIVNA